MSSQQGNALFLILIAVALFAALSYTITQSGRGGGNVQKEQTLITSSQIVQAISQIRFAVERMSITTGIPPENIIFCDTDDSACDTLGDGTALCTTGSNCLFAAEGGGLTDLSIPNGYGFYLYDERNAMRVSGVGTAASEIAIQLLADFSSPAMSKSMCDAINNGFGLTTENESTIDWIYGDGLSVDGEMDFCVNISGGATPNYRYISTIAAF